MMIGILSLVSLLLIHHVPQKLIADEVTDVFLKHYDSPGIRTGRIAGDMRREHDIREFPQWMTRGQWLRISDIQSGARQFVAVERLDERRRIIEAPAGDGDKKATFLHQIKLP